MIGFEIDYYPIRNPAFLAVDDSADKVTFLVDSNDRDLTARYQIAAERGEAIADLFLMDFVKGSGLEGKIGASSDTPDDVNARLSMMKMEGIIKDFRITMGADIIRGDRTTTLDLSEDDSPDEIPSWITEAIANG